MVPILIEHAEQVVAGACAVEDLIIEFGRQHERDVLAQDALEILLRRPRRCLQRSRFSDAPTLCGVVLVTVKPPSVCGHVGALRHGVRGDRRGDRSGCVCAGFDHAAFRPCSRSTTLGANTAGLSTSKFTPTVAGAGVTRFSSSPSARVSAGCHISSGICWALRPSSCCSSASGPDWRPPAPSRNRPILARGPQLQPVGALGLGAGLDHAVAVLGVGGDRSGA